MKHYSQLTLEQKYGIYFLFKTGQSIFSLYTNRSKRWTEKGGIVSLPLTLSSQIN